ncbi:MAG TPA: T9SS type A sorting domain-containing protein, partial [Draconibacterium sp.]|nr:T9SS type A sorting domain-containing protein [Draconibacterium sp.]
CCLSADPDSTLECISFNIYLDEDAAGLIMDVKNPAPVNAAYYRVNCGSPIALGEFICLTGDKTYTLTFCNPGEDRPDYIIQSVAGARTNDSITINSESECKAVFQVSGLDTKTISWSVKYPAGADSLLSYLDINDIENPVFNPDSESPSLIVFEVCGSINGVNCEGNPVVDCNQIVISFDGCNSLIMTSKNLNFDVENKLLVYPNPSLGVFSIEAGNENTQFSLLEVYDSGGLLILKQDLKNTNGIIKETFDLGNQPSGMYYLRIIDKNKPFTKTLIIEKTSD